MGALVVFCGQIIVRVSVTMELMAITHTESVPDTLPLTYRGGQWKGQ